MPLPPIGRRQFVATAGGALFCTLAGHQLSADSHVNLDKLARRSRCRLGCQAAAGGRRRRRRHRAPSSGQTREYWIKAVKTQVEHRPHRPRRDDGQEGQGQDAVHRRYAYRAYSPELRRAAGAAADPGPADRGRDRRHDRRPLPQQARRAGDDAPARDLLHARDGRRLQGQVHRPGRLRPDRPHVPPTSGRRGRAPRAPGSTTTTGRWTRCRSSRACSARCIIRKPGATRPDREFFIVFHSFPPVATGLDSSFDCINGRAYAGNTPTLRAKVGDSGSPSTCSRSTTTSTPSTCTATAGPTRRRPVIDNKTIGPGDSITAQFTEDNPGRWFYHCHVFSPPAHGDERVVHRQRLIAAGACSPGWRVARRPTPARPRRARPARKVAIGHYQWSHAVVHVDLGEHVTWYWVGPDTMHSVTGDLGQRPARWTPTRATGEPDHRRRRHLPAHVRPARHLRVPAASCTRSSAAR